jgi:hypothetical protein
MRIRVTTAAGLVVAVLILVGAPAADAEVKRFESRIRITSVDSQWTGYSTIAYIDGVVNSRKSHCLSKRRVRVQGKYHGKWARLREWRTTTLRHGDWEFQTSVNGIVGATRVRAKVLPKRLNNGNVCLADRSKTVDGPQ